jgi:release factor glutamine methyltransferase
MAEGTGGQPRTVLEVLRAATDYLGGRGVDTPRLDAELLAAEVLELSRLELYVQFDRPMEPAERDRLRELVRRRGAREPVALILGSKEFRSREFLVQPGVLIPRPDTELLAERAIAAVDAREGDAPLVVDLGTGTGILAISVALETDARVLAVDAAPAAVECARANLASLGPAERVGVVRGDWWDALPDRFAGQVEVVVSNPPYVADADYALLAPEIREYEPRLALTPDGDPLAYYRRTAAGLPRWLAPGGHLLVEVGAGQAADVSAILTDAHVTDIKIHPDLSGIERVVEGSYAP